MASMSTKAQLEGLLSPNEVAAYLGVPVKTVYRWNTTGTGPTYVRVGKHVRYRLADVDKWLASNAAVR